MVHGSMVSKVRANRNRVRRTKHSITYTSYRPVRVSKGCKVTDKSEDDNNCGSMLSPVKD